MDKPEITKREVFAIEILKAHLSTGYYSSDSPARRAERAVQEADELIKALERQ